MRKDFLNLQLKEYPQIMIDGCKEALEQGVFYSNEFCEFVINFMGGLDCAPSLVKIVDVTGIENNFQIKKDLEIEIAKLPRGHYLLIKNSWSGKDSYQTMVSDGRGNRVSVGGRYDFYDEIPTGDYVVTKMIDFEIYKCRQFLEEMIVIDKNVDALNKNKLAVGVVCKNYKHPGEVKPFSSATITEVDFGDGRVKLFMKKRGTKTTFTTSVGAVHFSEQLGLQEVEKEKHPLVVVTNMDSLF